MAVNDPPSKKSLADDPNFEARLGGLDRGLDHADDPRLGAQHVHDRRDAGRHLANPRARIFVELDARTRARDGVGAAGALFVFRDEVARTISQWAQMPAAPGGPVLLRPVPLPPIPTPIDPAPATPAESSTGSVRKSRRVGLIRGLMKSEDLRI